jgi:hypothetical protein
MPMGERADFQKLVGRLQRILKSKHQYPECCKELTPAKTRAISIRMTNEFREIAGNRRWIVTKMPEDFWHLGLIWMLFPRVKVIHCQRNAVETCLSCFMQDFYGIPYATDLDTLAFVYRQYKIAMDHWKNALPSGTILDVHNDDLITHPEQTLAAIGEFMGITLEAASETFYRSPRRVDTASRWQVRSPLKTSIEERRHNYYPFLGQLSGLETSGKS